MKTLHSVCLLVLSGCWGGESILVQPKIGDCILTPSSYPNSTQTNTRIFRLDGYDNNHYTLSYWTNSAQGFVPVTGNPFSNEDILNSPVIGCPFTIID